MQYGPVMIDLKGIELLPEEGALLKHPRVGGVILFSRNFKDIETLKSLVKNIRKEAGRSVLIAVDHEGGRVWRFHEGFTKLPPARRFGEAFDKNKEAGLNLAFHAGIIMAAELLNCGLDMSFTPVLDLDKGVSDVIGDRAFHHDPDKVAEIAKAFIEGMKSSGMSATGKHFPGHGSTVVDSHFDLP